MGVIINGGVGITALAAGPIGIADGGTGATTAPEALTNLLPVQTGLGGSVLGTNGTSAAWVSGGGGGVTQILAGTNVTISPTGGTGAVTINASGGGGTGTVTSVGITPGTGISVTGSPVTASGNITVNNTGVTSAVAGSNISVSGATGAVTISVTGTVPLANSSTTSITSTNIIGGAAGSLPYQSGVGATTLLPVGSTNQVLTVIGGVPTWQTPAGGGGVTQIVAGTNVTISPVGGTGAVTINSTGGTFTGGTVPNPTTFTSSVTGARFIPSATTIPTNGMFLPAANTVGLATNTGERMRIESDGTIHFRQGDATISQLPQQWNFAASNNRAIITLETQGDPIGDNWAGIYFNSKVGTSVETVASLIHMSGASPFFPNSIILQNDQGGPIIFNPNFLEESMRILATGAVSFGGTGTATGTAGQVLKSSGNGAPPVWQAATVLAADIQGDIDESQLAIPGPGQPHLLARLANDEIISANWVFTKNLTVPAVPTTSTHAASKQYVDSKSAGLVMSVPPSYLISAVAGNFYVLTDTIYPSIVTLPSTATIGDTVAVSNFTTRIDGAVKRNGHKINGVAQDLMLDTLNATDTLRYTNVSIGWIVVR